MPKWLPSSRILFTLLFLLVVGGALLFFSFDDGDDDGAGIAVISSDYEKIDIDEDGLPDWEEELWSTDMLNPDTDGDGTTDGEEVRNNRHPRVAGPGDSIEEDHKNLLYVNAESVQRSFSKTEQFVNDAMPDTFALTYERLTGEDISATEIEDLARSISDQIGSRKATRAYKPEDFKTISSPTEEDYRNYLISILDMLENVTDDSFSAGNEIELVAVALSEEDDSVLEPLIQSTRFYKVVSEQLLAMQVPEDMQTLHVRLTNNYNGLVGVVGSLRYILADPVRGMEGVNLYGQYVSENEEILQEIGLLLSQKLKE